MIIYKAVNKKNGKIYIGKTVRNLKTRMSRHLHESKKDEKNTHFYNAIKKHGFESFEWSVVEKCINENHLNLAEQAYIELYKMQGFELYNMTKGGDGILGCSRTIATRKKISESTIGREAPNKGKPHSEETKNKIREKAKLRKASDETKNKMSEARKKYKVPESVCIKISESRKNQIPPMTGKKHSENTKIKMSESAFKRWNEK